MVQSAVRSPVSSAGRLFAALLLFMSVLAVGSSTSGAQTAAAADDDRPSATVTGRGWGHGRGMGQYGAQGYALDGWTAEQILGHFYSNTTAGDVSALNGTVNPNAGDPENLRVELRSRRGEVLRVDLEIGTVGLFDATSGVSLTDGAGTELTAVEGAVRVFAENGKMTVEVGASCAGPWTFVATGPVGGVEIRPNAADGQPTSQDLLRVCHDDGTSTWYQGRMRAHNIEGQTRTVNVVSLEGYLRGVVPNEVPASWEPAALQAQAVAARSYAAAGDTRQQPYADTCDTTLCQVYRGRYRQTPNPPPGRQAFDLSTAATTDAAIAATDGVVRLMPDGAVARTEFSSSTGGYTAGGTFPSVVDAGDATPANPNSSWSVRLDLTAFEESAGLGKLVEVTANRNGLGADGGRVINATFVFENGSFTRTGNEVRREFGLKSDWFTFGTIERGSVTAEATAYVNHVHQLFLGRDAGAAEIFRWAPSVDAGSYVAVTDSLAVSDEWAGVMVDDLYQKALGRPADAEGRAHWVAQIARGVRVESVGVQFYGSPEYYNQTGATNAAFVEQLYIDLLGRDADPGGRDHWVSMLDEGILTTADVAGGFYASVESRRDRVVGLYQRILGREPDADGLVYWTDQLLGTDDVRLASLLAASRESFLISQR